MACSWIYTGESWEENPDNPHDCPQGTICTPPTGVGTLNEEQFTDCEGPGGTDEGGEGDINPAFTRGS